MSEDDEHSAGRPYWGVAVICKVMQGAAMIKDTHGKPVHLIMSVYMPIYNGSNVQRGEFLMCIDALQVIIDHYGEQFP